MVAENLAPTGISNNAFCTKHMLTNVSVYYQNTNLLAHCITLTCFNPQRAMLWEYDLCTAAAGSTKWVTRRKFQLSKQHRHSFCV